MGSQFKSNKMRLLDICATVIDSSDDPYEDMCEDFDPRFLRGFRAKLCGGQWQKVM